MRCWLDFVVLYQNLTLVSLRMDISRVNEWHVPQAVLTVPELAKIHRSFTGLLKYVTEDLL